MGITLLNSTHTAGLPSRVPKPYSVPDIPSSTLKQCGELLGSAKPMLDLFNMIERVSPTDATVLVIGESGTGKELVARSVYEQSKRVGTGPFIAINCGALPAGLIESELFGFERGSFTGADRLHRGIFERAAGGTIFLDEITEMAIELQVKLLRILESNQFSRIGGSETVKTNVRLIAATNRCPQEAVAQGRLRQDLLYRLSVFPLQIPALRERTEDIALLAQVFLNDLNHRAGTKKLLSKKAVPILQQHTWPGNVRELKNVIERAFILADTYLEFDGVLLPSAINTTQPDTDSIRIAVGTPLADAEHELIIATLNRYGGNKRRTAEILGLSLKTLYNRLNDYRDDATNLQKKIAIVVPIAHRGDKFNNAPTFRNNL